MSLSLSAPLQFPPSRVAHAAVHLAHLISTARLNLLSLLFSKHGRVTGGHAGGDGFQGNILYRMEVTSSMAGEAKSTRTLSTESEVSKASSDAQDRSGSREVIRWGTQANYRCVSGGL